MTLLILLVGIVWACTLFTNAIEWLGCRFNLSQGAVGSVLAAVGTALPETIIPILALNAKAPQIGIGAILGAPFLLGTLAMGVSGIAVYYGVFRGQRNAKLNLDVDLFIRDLKYFFMAYGMVCAATFIHSALIKDILALGLVGFYGFYVIRTLAKKSLVESGDDLEPLLFAPKHPSPSTTLMGFQALVGVLGIIILAHLFIGQIETLAGLWHISPLIISLLIVPIATEMPEKFNSVTWILKKKDGLALANITGAMVFQSCIPAAIGVAFTPWVLNLGGYLSMILCFASAGLIFLTVLCRRSLSAGILVLGGLFYLVFLIARYKGL